MNNSLPSQPQRALRPYLTVILAAVLTACQKEQPAPAAATAASGASTSSVASVPTSVPLEQQVAARRAAQVEAAKGWKFFHDFRFVDRVAESGIRFEHHVVEDAGKHYKPVHYDHGNGLAVADVDGDGHPDLFFCNQIGGNQLWRNTGAGKFEDITATAGVALPERVSVAASFADIDNDGDPDLFVTTVRMGNVLFENQGGGRFLDISREAGVDYVGHSSGVTFFDFNRDGLLDLFVANIGVYTTDVRGEGGYYVAFKDAFTGHLKPERTEASILYQNLGQHRFKDVSQTVNLYDTSWSGDATMCDVNSDGYPDLYVVNMQGDNHLYENMAGTRFEEKTGQYFPKTPWGAMGVKFFDFDGNGRMDLFVTDMHSDMTDAQTKLSQKNATPDFEMRKSEVWCTAQFTDAFLQGASNNIFGNAFYLNQGEGRFLEVSDKIGAETFWPWGMSVGDLNADGFEDAYVTAGMGYGFRYAANALLLNEAGQRFVESAFVLGTEPRLGGRQEKTAFVLECSGKDSGHPLCLSRSGNVPVKEALSSRSSVFVDLEGDGDLDIVTNEMNDRPQVLVSDLAQKRPIHFLKVKLVGTKSNRDALGAMVRVRAGGRVRTQYSDGKSGYLAQSALPLYFGLADATSIEQVEVIWPSGKTQLVAPPISIDALLSVTEAAN